MIKNFKLFLLLFVVSFVCGLANQPKVFLIVYCVVAVATSILLTIREKKRMSGNGIIIILTTIIIYLILMAIILSAIWGVSKLLNLDYYIVFEIICFLVAFFSSLKNKHIKL